MSSDALEIPESGLIDEMARVLGLNQKPSVLPVKHFHKARKKRDRKKLHKRRMIAASRRANRRVK